MSGAPRTPGQSGGRREPPSPPPRSRDGDGKPPGWRVDPAPDGRGGDRPPRFGFGRRFLIVVLALLALNFWGSTLIPSTHERVRVPYFPTFLEQVRAHNVASISSRGSTVQGTFRHKVTYPRGKKGAKTSRYFDTEVPTFANQDQLTNLLQTNGVTVNASSPEQGRSLLANLLLGFGPTLLLVGLFVWLGRRAARPAGGGLMGFGRSRARRGEACGPRGSFQDVAGVAASDGEGVP